MLLTVADTAYLGPVPLSHSVQRGASQKSIPDWKNRNRQHKLHKG